MRGILVSFTLVVATLARAAGQQAVPRAAVASTDADLFDDRLLQRIELQVSERDWATLRQNYLLNTYYPATLVWRGETVRSVGIRSRGTGTRSGTKPNLLVDFDRYVTGQRFLGLEGLVLDNHLQDPSSMREAITMAVYARLGLPAPREAAAALFINGEFFGLYNLVERVDEVSLARMFAPPVEAPPPSPDGDGRRDADAGGGRRRVEAGLAGRPVPPSLGGTARSLLPPPATAPPAEPVGYLFDYNWVDAFTATYPGPDLEFYAERFEADTRDDEPLEVIYRPIDEMFRAVNEARDGEFVERVSPWLDLPQFVRIAAVQAYMAEWDGLLGYDGMNNFYLYRPAAGPPHVIIPWDEDNAFRDVNQPVDAGIAENVIMRKAMAVPELRALFVTTVEGVARLAEAPEASGRGWLENEVVRRAGLIRARVIEDQVKPFTTEEFEAAVAFNLEFARRRPAIVRAQLAAVAASAR